MRDSLKKSIAESSVDGFDRYPKGSIVLCHSCSLPIFTLETGIALGDKAGRMAERFKPLTLADLSRLAVRRDLDAGLRATISAMDLDARKQHIACLHEMRSGDPMLCPVCHECFVQVLAVEKSEVIDRAYTIELVTIPPASVKAHRMLRPKRVTAIGDWIH